MKIKNCKMCNSEWKHENILPERFPWSRDSYEDYFTLECQNCGKKYTFSVTQYLLLFTLNTVIFSILLVIHNLNRYVIPQSFIVIMFGLRLTCRCVWNNNFWKEIVGIQTFHRWMPMILCCIVMAVSFPIAVLIVASIF